MISMSAVVRAVHYWNRSNPGRLARLLYANPYDLNWLSLMAAEAGAARDGLAPDPPEVPTNRITGGHMLAGVETTADPDVEQGTMWINDMLVRL